MLEERMAKLTVDQWVAAATARLTNLTQTFAITLFAGTASMFMILSYAPSAGIAARFALATLVLAAVVYGVLASKAALDDLKAMAEDVVDDLSGSGFGAHLKHVPFPLFTGSSVILIVAVGLTQLWVIIST